VSDVDGPRSHSGTIERRGSPNGCRRNKKADRKSNRKRKNELCSAAGKSPSSSERGAAQKPHAKRVNEMQGKKRRALSHRWEKAPAKRQVVRGERFFVRAELSERKIPAEGNTGLRGERKARRNDAMPGRRGRAKIRLIYLNRRIGSEKARESQPLESLQAREEIESR